jgi:hypothetical protein
MRLQCVLFGMLWAIMYLFLACALLIACLAAIPFVVGAGSGGAVAWDPVSIARQQPPIAAAVLLIFVGLPIFGFVRGYRCRARRAAPRALA